MSQSDPFQLGWEEWLTLPDLGLPAIKAKVDTGARTSALHASVIEPFGPADAPQVRFLIQPDPSDPGLEITCSAPVVDRRDVTSSNGDTELRYVIQTDVEMGGRRWPIQLTLTNRESMTYRMLFGRGAIQPDMIVNANASFLQPKLDFAAYAGLPKKKPVKRPLRIALLTREPRNYSSLRLIEAAQERGHVIEAIDTARCYMQIGTTHPQVHYDGKALPRYDAVIPRIGASITNYGLAILRQFEMRGCWPLNESVAIGRSRDKLRSLQILAKHGLGLPLTAYANDPKKAEEIIRAVKGPPVVIKLLEGTQGIGVVLADSMSSAKSVIEAFRGANVNILVQEFIKEAGGTDIRALVIGGKVVAAMKRTGAPDDFRSNLHRGGSAQLIKITPEERSTAVRAAKRMGLNVCGVDMLRSNHGPVIMEVNSSPGLEGIEAASGKDIAGQIIEFIEKSAKIGATKTKGAG